jgi:peptidoglycan/xylan/chitin deacetylase (PgdA/CDA1 family)
VDWYQSVLYGNAIPSRATIITFDDAYSSLVEYAFPALLKHGFTATVFVPTALVGQSIACNPDRPDVTLPVMNREQISEWAAKGIDFGAHSHQHVDLAALAASEAESEMKASSEYLAELIGEPVDTMAYPYGRSNEAVRERAGTLYSTAFTIEEGLNYRETSLVSLKRTMVQHGDTVADICLRAGYGRSVLARARTTVRRSLGASAKRSGA